MHRQTVGPVLTKNPAHESSGMRTAGRGGSVHRKYTYVKRYGRGGRPWQALDTLIRGLAVGQVLCLEAATEFELSVALYSAKRIARTIGAQFVWEAAERITVWVNPQVSAENTEPARYVFRVWGILMAKNTGWQSLCSRDPTQCATIPSVGSPSYAAEFPSWYDREAA